MGQSDAQYLYFILLVFGFFSIPHMPELNYFITSKGWMYSMYMYGTLRQIRTTSPDMPLFIDKLGLALINGLIYSFPLSFYYVLATLLYRINIYLQKVEPRMHVGYYTELAGNINYNVLF